MTPLAQSFSFLFPVRYLQPVCVLRFYWGWRVMKKIFGIPETNRCDRLLMKSSASHLLGFHLNPTGECSLLTRSHTYQEPGACQEVSTGSPSNFRNAVVSMSRVGPALQCISFNLEGNSSDYLSRSHKTKASGLCTFFFRSGGKFEKSTLSPNSPSHNTGFYQARLVHRQHSRWPSNRLLQC